MLLLDREREPLLRDEDERELLLRVEPELPFELDFFAVERLRLDADFGFAADERELDERDEEERDEDERDDPPDEREPEERDDDEREEDERDDDAAARGLRSRAGISAVTTCLVSFGS